MSSPSSSISQPCQPGEINVFTSLNHTFSICKRRTLAPHHGALKGLSGVRGAIRALNTFAEH